MQPLDWYMERCASGTSLCMEEKKRIESDYREVFGRPMLSDFSGRCPNRFRDAAAMIASYLRKEQKGANGGYMLKSGIVIRYRGKLYTHLNLTAAAARHHLRQHPSNVHDFLRLGYLPKTERHNGKL